MSTRENQYLGYDHEASYGTSPIDDAADTAYWLGVTADVMDLPYPENVLYDPEPAAGSALSTSGAYAKTTVPRGTLAVAPVDAVPFYLAMGASSTSGAGPYTHTITFGAPGHTPPSISLYHEVSGSGGTLLAWLIKGVVATRCTLLCGVGPAEDILKLMIEVQGQLAAAAGFTLTSPPQRRISGSRPYTWGDLASANGAYTYGGSTLTGLQRIQVSWDTGYRVLLAHRASGGTNLSHRPYVAVSGRPTRPLITLEGEFDSDTFLDDLVSSSPTNDLVLKWHRGSNDTVQIDATNCWPVSGPVRLGGPGDPASQRVVLAPMGGFQVTAVDSIGGSHYNE